VDSRLRDIMKEAYMPCEGKSFCECNGIKYEPSSGHMPRGFCGATGQIEDVKLVLVLAEPGTPKDEHYDEGDVDYMLEQHIKKVGVAFDGDRDKLDLFHKNTGKIVEMCFDKKFIEVKKHIWITESVLCSLPPDNKMPADVVRKCGNKYLIKQYELLKHAYWVVLGGDAEKRLRRILHIPYQQHVYHPSCRPIHEAAAVNSWKVLANNFKNFINNKSKGVQDER